MQKAGQEAPADRQRPTDRHTERKKDRQTYRWTEENKDKENRRMEANLGTCSKHIPWTRSDEDRSLSRQNKEVDLYRSDCAPLCLHHRYYHSATKNSNHSNRHALQKWKIFKIQATRCVISILTLHLDKGQSYGDNEKKNAVADPGEGPEACPPPPPYF